MINKGGEQKKSERKREQRAFDKTLKNRYRKLTAQPATKILPPRPVPSLVRQGMSQSDSNHTESRKK